MIVLAKAAQTGWTAGFTGLLGSLIDNDPSRILVIMPTQDEAEIWSKDRLEPNTRATPALRAKVAGYAQEYDALEAALVATGWQFAQPAKTWGRPSSPSPPPNPATIASRWGSERPSRSSFQTTSTSPALR